MARLLGWDPCKDGPTCGETFATENVGIFIYYLSNIFETGSTSSCQLG